MATRRSGSARNTRRKKTTGTASPLSREFKSFAAGIVCIVLVILGMTAQGGCSSTSDEPESSSESGGTERYEGLRDVITNPSLAESVFSHYSAMRISFNSDARQPNWVAWELTAQRTNGSVPRADNFLNDPRVYGCPFTTDYTRSGYDRGHMCPAADNKWSEFAMKECFYMTNICPQVHEMNAGAWEHLEAKCRDWARADGTIYIVAGPILTDNLTETIGQSGVKVPRRFFKVIIAPYSDPPRGIGFIMNNGSVPGGIQTCAVSIDRVEEITGHDFFSTLPDDIETRLESQCNFTQWSAIK